MLYRALGNTGFQVSEVGLGCEYLEGKPYEQVRAVVDAALQGGINLLDCFMSEPNVRSNLGRALKGRREQVYLQGHLRSVWKNGQYGRTMDVGEVRFFFEDLLTRLQTDYIDLGMIHLVDNPADYHAIFDGEIFRYALSLREKGILRSIGISTHNPATALEAAKSGNIDVMLLSVNPAYDLMHEEAARPRSLGRDFFQDKPLHGLNRVREDLYRYCESRGIGITAMKVLAAGALLKESTSPFGCAMSVQQCMHFALTRPAVASALVGMQTVEEVEDCLRYKQMSDAEKDFSFLFTRTPAFGLDGRCLYCNHCLPCTANINIAQVGKYLDMAMLEGGATPTLRAHYDSLAHKAGECVRCGNCQTQCPFGVPVIERMRAAAELFEAVPPAGGVFGG